MTEPSRTPYEFAATANPQVPRDVGGRWIEMKKIVKIMSGVFLAGASIPVVVGMGVVVLAVFFILAAWVLSLFGIEPWPVPQ